MPGTGGQRPIKIFSIISQMGSHWVARSELTFKRISLVAVLIIDQKGASVEAERPVRGVL